MKKLGLVLLFWCMTVANASAQNVDEVVDDYMTAWSEHNIPKIDSFYAKNVIWYDLPSDRTTQGHSKVTKAITDAFMAYVPDMYWVKSGDTFSSGNTVAYEWIYGGTFNGSWGDIKIEHKKFSIKGFSTTTINDEGKIIAQKDYYDLDSFKRALGIAK